MRSSSAPGLARLEPVGLGGVAIEAGGEILDPVGGHVELDAGGACRGGRSLRHLQREGELLEPQSISVETLRRASVLAIAPSTDRIEGTVAAGSAIRPRGGAGAGFAASGRPEAATGGRRRGARVQWLRGSARSPNERSGERELRKLLALDEAAHDLGCGRRLGSHRAGRWRRVRRPPPRGRPGRAARSARRRESAGRNTARSPAEFAARRRFSPMWPLSISA